jgi:hypothetical protein
MRGVCEPHTHNTATEWMVCCDVVVNQMKVEESDLANSQGLGKLIVRLWESKQETLPNKKLLQALIEKWTRPIFGATVDYKKLAEVERKKAKEMIARKGSLG